MTIRPGVLPASLLVAGGFAAPLCFVLAQSLRDQRGPLAPYVELLSDPYYLLVLGETVALSAGVALAVVILGFPFGWVIARSSERLRQVLTFLILVPLLTNAVVRSLGWIILLGNNGLIIHALRALHLPAGKMLYTWWAVCIGLFHVMLPFAILSTASVLSRVDRRVEEAARTLGASPLRVLRDVTIPVAVPGLVAAGTLVFALTSGGFVTVVMLGGSGQQIYSSLIYQQITLAGDLPLASAMGVVLLLSVLAVLAFRQRVVALVSSVLRQS